MNRVKLLLVGSVALNVGLLTLLILTRASTPNPSPSRPGAEDDSFSRIRADAPNNRVATDTGQASSPRPGQRAHEYRQLFQSLRAAGIEERIAVRAVRGVAMLDWSEYKKRLFPPHLQIEPWKAPIEDKRRLALQREMIEARRELETILTEALGEVQNLEPWNDLRPYLPPATSPAKARAVAWLEEDYDLLKEELSPSDQDGFRLLLQARHDDLTAILSADEVEHYELRRSTTASNLRENLRHFHPTEKEFRSLFRRQYQSDLQLPGQIRRPQDEGDPATPGPNEIEQILGEERFRDYLRSQDPEFRQLADLVEQLGLPDDRGVAVYRFAQFANEQRRLIETDADLDLQEKGAAIRLLLEETREVIIDHLGPEGYEAYVGQGGLVELELDLEALAAQP